MRSGSDAELGLHVGMRHDVPRHHLLKILETASAAVCRRIVAANPEIADAVKGAVTDVIDDINLDLFGSPMAASGGAAPGEVAAIAAAGQDEEAEYGGADATDTGEADRPREQSGADAAAAASGRGDEEPAEDGDAEDVDAAAASGGPRSHPDADGEDGERRMPHAAAD